MVQPAKRDKCLLNFRAQFKRHSKGCFLGLLAENSTDLGYSIQELYQIGNFREDGIVIFLIKTCPPSLIQGTQAASP